MYNLTKNYNEVKAIDNISFKVFPGEIFALLGPNGAGKTTTIRILSCLIKPTEGEAKIGNFSIFGEENNIRQIIGALVEQPGLYYKLTGIEYLEFFGKLYGLDKKRREERIKFLLNLLDIWKDRNKRLSEFSMGMRQKISIAKALIHDPKILLLDEPTAGLDANVANSLMNYLKEETKKNCKTILISTHHLVEIEEYCDRVAIISNGKILVSDTPSNIKKKYQKKILVEVLLSNWQEKIYKELLTIDFISDITFSSNTLMYETDNFEKVSPIVIKKLINLGIDVISVIPKYKNLKELYFEIISSDER